MAAIWLIIEFCTDAPEEEEEGSDRGAPPKSAARPKRKSEASASKSAKKAKKSSSDTPKKPSAFTRPLKVSPELSAWLGGDTEISRPQLTKRFWDYAKVAILCIPAISQAAKLILLGCETCLF